jgi:membrane-associated phospholipid phosphatase
MSGMAYLAARPSAFLGHIQKLAPGFWQVDWVITGYLAAIGLLIAAFYPRVPYAGWLLAAHAAAVGLIAWASRMQPEAGTARYHFAVIFRYWYPLPFVAACYKEMAILIPPTRGIALDAQVAALDYRIWGANPTVWLERISAPWLTEFLQIAYTLFVPAVLLVAGILWKQWRLQDFRYYALLISAGFLASYLGYWLLPVRGPRFLLANLQTAELRGLWLFPYLQHTLDKLESAHYDCFPSGHVELTLMACWGSRLISPNLFRTYLVYSLVIVFATVYLRYHYTIDVFAGVFVAAVLIAVLERFCREPSYHGT